MAKNRIPVKEAAAIMGVSQSYIRIGLQRGILPIGTAVKMSSMWTYYISPKLLYDFVGTTDNYNNIFVNKEVLQ